MMQNLIEQAAQIMVQAHYGAVFTGAGIGTESGIPDFRSRDSGLWDDINPMEVASIYGFKHNPRAFFDWVRPLARTTLAAQPNAAHLALAHLEREGLIRGVITQNIDNLHRRAGSQQVYELHGHMRQATCIQCYHEVDATDLIADLVVSGTIPYCPKCNGILKPNVILFGEQLPIRVFLAAQEVARMADVMLVIGSSLVVEPACQLPELAVRTGARLIIINLEPTPADHLADVIIRDRAAVILPALAGQLERLIHEQHGNDRMAQA